MEQIRGSGAAVLMEQARKHERRAALRRAAQGMAPLTEVFETLALCRLEQESAAADLAARETWAVAMIVAASEPIWKARADTPLRFPVDRPGGDAAYHLELGHFRHLSALACRSAGEQAILDAAEPCWARVTPNPERQRMGKLGPLGCSYEPISTGEAVGKLGLAKILMSIDAAARAVGQSTLAEAESLDEREDLLQRVERMLGWTPEPVVPRTPPRREALKLAAGAAYAVFVAVFLFFLIGAPYTFLTFMLVGPALVIWRCLGTA